MKISVLIIAHNEEKHIAECVKAVLDQTQKADEVVLIVHNSTDRTLEISKRFPITAIPFEGKRGTVYPRIEGIDHVTGDIVLCLDGDTVPENNWIEEMAKILTINNNILVGSWVKGQGSFLAKLMVYKNKNIRKGSTAVSRIWGPSYGFWGKQKTLVKDIFIESAKIAEDLKLTRSCDDYWLAQKMDKMGNLGYTNKTFVTQHTKENNSLGFIRRHKENSENIRRIQEYLKRLAD